MWQLYDWFWNTLSSLGLYNKSAKMVFIGLDNAGKTTLMHMLRDNKLQSFMPTQKPTTEELCMGNIVFTAYDLGGHEIARRVWHDFYVDIDAIVFIIDAASPERFKESKVELDELLNNEDLRGVPFLVLGNKIDCVEAVEEHTLRGEFDLTRTYGKGMGVVTTADVRPLEVFMCSVVKRQGYKEGFNWLAQFI